jgi:hypothetical protein
MAVDPKKLTDVSQLRNLIENAKRHDRQDIVAACVDRLVELGASSAGAASKVEEECWKAIFAAEEFATQQKGRTVRLSRTRQKVARVGVIATISDLAGSPKVQEGFDILKTGNRLDLSFEAIAVRNPDVFESAVRSIAAGKLRDAGFNLSTEADA